MNMMKLFQNWTGSVIVNGVEYSSIMEVPSFEGTFHITLKAANKAVESQNNINTQNQSNLAETGGNRVRITVKKYMTEKSNPRFDFMAKWNHDEPMPFRIMVGTKVKETPGMVYMKLQADMWAEKMTTCMCCGKVLTNPVSQYFGIGPECGHHKYINPFDTEEELKAAVSEYRKTLQNVKWEGWIIKSAITEEVAV